MQAICVWLEGNVSLPVRYSYLSILPYNHPDIFGSFLLISNCSCSSLMLFWVVMVKFYIFSKNVFLKPKEISYARAVSITKKEYGFAVHFLQRFIKSWGSISG